MPASSAVVTVPNILSFARIALIPVFCWLSANERTRLWGIVLFAVVVSTDWVDGYVARRTGQVSELGRILDPVADRLADRGRSPHLRDLGHLPVLGCSADPGS